MFTKLVNKKKFKSMTSTTETPKQRYNSGVLKCGICASIWTVQVTRPDAWNEAISDLRAEGFIGVSPDKAMRCEFCIFTAWQNRKTQTDCFANRFINHDKEQDFITNEKKDRLHDWIESKQADEAALYRKK
jgi:hypothetical protein